MNELQECNVIGSLWGLGQDIMLELLNEMSKLQDVQQFLCVSKKTYALQYHARFLSILKSLININCTSLIQSAQDIDSQGDTFTCLVRKCSTVLFDYAISFGIVRFELLNVKCIQGFGIVDDSINYNLDLFPQSKDWNKIVYYYQNGWVRHLGSWAKGNKQFKTGDRIALEAYLCWQGECFKVLNFKHILQPTAKLGVGSYALKFGQYWTR
ncbi:MAG: hypothetical protein EZS28_024348 [Streblomastix strix]|uniref:Uncharacterized protein n=1 Tax=Streblomastix strix TaxID=222440 RepID=A0A5J4VC43_9EUKA|nr:MAG: hypothetical protein EZS28_024348 [Streblomastix strix]